MASTLTETTRSALMSHVPSSPSTKNTSDIISQLKDSASNTPQTSNTSNIRDPSRSSFDAASQSLLAQNMAQMSRHSSQQAGLSSLAIAAMAGGKMKEEPMQNRSQLSGSNAGNGGNNHAASTPTSVGNAGLNHNQLQNAMNQQADQMAQPTCQNCTTSTTPLWRRDEIGSVLCNACGLFLKLHGRPRPISLKTDVIKSRNRVKTSGPGQQKKKSLFDQNNGLGAQQQQHGQHGTPQQDQMNQQRRPSQQARNGHSDGSGSPISRTGTPNMYGNHMSAFNGNDLVDHQFNSPHLGGMHMGRPASPGRSESSINGNLDMPQTFEQLIATNSSLKTRVSELEVINELFRGRVTQLEQDEANARRGEEMRRESERNLRMHLDESQRTNNNLKRTIEDLHRQLAEARGESLEELTHKKPRMDDGMQHMNHMADMGQMGNMGQMSSLDQDNLDHMGQHMEHVDHGLNQDLDQHIDHGLEQGMDSQKYDEGINQGHMDQNHLEQNLDDNLDPALDPSLGGEGNQNELIDPVIKADEDALLANVLDDAPTPEL